MTMTTKGVATDALARHLHAAIERVREDMQKVEFWADAMTSFSEPVPEYKPDDVTVWLPSEQAAKISATKEGNGRKPRSASKRR
jgi:hypothetical protein